jgi:hypothetical protein
MCDFMMFSIFKKLTRGKSTSNTLSDGEGTSAEQSMQKGLLYGLGGAAIVVIVILGLIFSSSIKELLPSFGKSDSDGARLKLIVVTKKDCTDCFDTSLFVDTLKQLGDVEIASEKTVYIDDRTGKKLVEQYKIEKVPTVLITGDLDKVNQQYQQLSGDTRELWSFLGEVIDKTFVWRQVVPPYIEVSTGELKGKVSIIYLSDSSCSQCYEVSLHGNALKNLGVDVNNATTVDVGSDEGKDLIDRYAIELVPTVIIQGEVDQYQSIAQLWTTYGKVTDDGSYIFTKVDEMGTYRNLTTGEVTTVELPELTAPVQVQQ